ncbi:hypothetical protein [Mycolicibacterium sp. HK-90]|uniref:hypothetical protein n=1 Tax=Mycolicibacterium sp. HK-90 TaxID=3056937 RepID=UPI002657AE85|nr:hypothetical protein [Mycolicibacterium sp. HK-90]WKG00823.1 hypothetical protein QU592_15985 [Mycolicibacterium sp. HK-90]
MQPLSQWSSLSDQVKLANELFGSTIGEQKVANWLAEQRNLVDDVEFAQQFAAQLRLPGIAVLDYAHRHVRTRHGQLLGGIRFYSRNTARPFVDVLAHNFHDIDDLTECVVREWAGFNARYLRLRTAPGLFADRPDVILDRTIHVAPYRDMAPADGRVRLHPFGDPDDAISLVNARYAELAATDPTLANNLSVAAPEDLRRWHFSDQLRAIRAHNTTIGALAVVPSAIGWISGEEIHEEVISEPHAGQGYAASAQTAWARCMAVDVDQLLIGTIDRHNHASRTTAQRTGRPRVLEDIFITWRA